MEVVTMDKKLTLQQYNTLKAIHENNSQGKSFEEYLEAVCLLKDLEYDPSIHEEVQAKVPLQEHIKRSKAGLGESSKSTHKHELKRVEERIRPDNPYYNCKGKEVIVYMVCKCGYKVAVDLI